MNKIILYSPAISTLNRGDDIIFDSASSVMNDLFPKSFFVHICTHLPVSRSYMNHVRDAQLRVVCGSNLLMPNLLGRFRQWDIDLLNASTIGPAVLLGVGWWQYGKATNLYTRAVYRRVLSKKYIHSVRDSYTEERLRKIGINNVVNTACPTMWSLTPNHCREIPTRKGSVAVLTLTDYMQDRDRDKAVVATVLRNYSRVHYWIQGYNDYDYFRSLGLGPEIKMISPCLASFDEVLSSEEQVDYVGTRLHAGIRALQKGRRSIIVGIDNRAAEKKSDFGLVVVDRKNIDELERTINDDFETKISIPLENIQCWKSAMDEHRRREA